MYKLFIRIILFFPFFFFIDCMYAQNCYPEKRKDKKLARKIEKLIKKRNYYSATDLLKNLRDVSYLYVLKSEILWREGNFFNAEKEALRAIDSCPGTFPKANFFLGEIAYNRKDYVNAYFYLKQAIHLKIGDPYYSNAVVLFENAKVLAEIINNPVAFNPKIVKGVSTLDDEYLPVISPDQDILFFTRRLDKKNLHSITINTVEEFVFSERKNDGFEVGKPLSYPFNTEGNEGGASITIDNNKLFYTKCIRDSKGYNDCNLYYVNREDSSWSVIYDLPKIISKEDSWESQPTISADGKTIIFASDRIGGYGKIDLYEINKINGNWTAPKNLGSNINSNEYEKSPYLHTDGKTLFFASTNFPTLGGFDIFFSRKDSLGNWQKPVNIGYPINTINDEVSLVVSTDGNQAYFASNTLNGIGGWDIYSFDLYDKAKPQKVLFLKGSVLNDNKSLDNVFLEIKNIRKKKITKINIDEGLYVSSITLDQNDDFLVTVKKEGYAFHSTYINTNDSSFSSPSELNIEMYSLNEGESFNIDNVYFENNSYVVNNATKEVLIEFAKYLTVNSTLVIEINGFTDNIGSKEDNQLLSENRAKAVRDIVLSYGIAKDRVFFKGFGESFPLSTNDTEDGRSLNRRTEFKIIKK